MKEISKGKKEEMRKIACFAYGHTQYYNKLYKKCGINPYDVDIPYGLPIIDHSVLIDNPYEIKSDLKMYKLCASSGTILSPKIMYRTYEDFEKSVINEIELLRMSGVKEGDTVAIIQPFGIWGYGEITQEAVRRYGAVAIPLWNIDDERVLQMLIMNNVTVLDVSPSRLINILQIAKETDQLTALNIRTAMCAGEAISENTIKKIEAMYNMKLYSQYGCEELDGLGGTDDTGKMRLFTDDFIFEIWNEEQNRPCDIDEVGSLLVTSLYHRGSPLIRCNLQDLVRMGRDGFEILGRKSERVVLYDSVKIFPYQIDLCIQEVFQDTVNWQCCITEDDGKIVITIRLVVNDISVEKRDEAVRKLEKCSIDINELVLCQKIIFQIDIIDDENYFMVSGKGRKIIDMRK